VQATPRCEIAPRAILLPLLGIVSGLLFVARGLVLVCSTKSKQGPLPKGVAEAKVKK
jgi:hypothetical protein